MKDIGIYIHIPFCKQKCLYCDFVSFKAEKETQKSYIQALKREIQNWKQENKEYEIKTIYIGGGTPSYIDSYDIFDILNLLTENIKEEKNKISITIEVNPGTITKQKLQDYKKAGINRLSIGLQSTNNNLLKQIGRIHNYQEFLETYKLAREVGFENINVDLMIGQHISVYSLIVEDETPIQKLIESGKLKLPDEEKERQMYWYVKDYLELHEYKHYEISNFAKEGYDSKHNMDCWNQKEYKGFRLAAHSYIENKRFCNIDNLDEYISNCENEDFEANIIIQEVQNKEEQMKEYMLLGLRKIDGISIQQFENKFNQNPIMLFRNELQRLDKQKLITIDGDTIKLSIKGLDLANIVWEEFV